VCAVCPYFAPWSPSRGCHYSPTRWSLPHAPGCGLPLKASASVTLIPTGGGVATVAVARLVLPGVCRLAVSRGSWPPGAGPGLRLGHVGSLVTCADDVVDPWRPSKPLSASESSAILNRWITGGPVSHGRFASSAAMFGHAESEVAGRVAVFCCGTAAARRADGQLGNCTRSVDGARYALVTVVLSGLVYLDQSPTRGPRMARVLQLCLAHIRVLQLCIA
jgi:hypothetical protein